MEQKVKFISRYNFEYIQCLKTLETCKKEFTIMKHKLKHFRGKLTMDVLVPASKSSSLAYFEGVAVHTNELLVVFGANYCVKMTTKDAVIFCDRKITEINLRIKYYLEQQKLILERFSCLHIDKFKRFEIVEYSEECEQKCRGSHVDFLHQLREKEMKDRKLLQANPCHYLTKTPELEWNK